MAVGAVTADGVESITDGVDSATAGVDKISDDVGFQTEDVDLISVGVDVASVELDPITNDVDSVAAVDCRVSVAVGVSVNCTAVTVVEVAYSEQRPSCSSLSFVVLPVSHASDASLQPQPAAACSAHTYPQSYTPHGSCGSVDATVGVVVDPDMTTDGGVVLKR